MSCLSIVCGALTGSACAVDDGFDVQRKCVDNRKAEIAGDDRQRATQNDRGGRMVTDNLLHAISGDVVYGSVTEYPKDHPIDRRLPVGRRCENRNPETPEFVLMRTRVRSGPD